MFLVPDYIFAYNIIIESFDFSGLDKKQREVAMIAEMIHSASLIHDDVIDQSDFRRGKPSVNALWSHKKVCNMRKIIIMLCHSAIFYYSLLP